nr:MAG TPA: hypothetical protein [Caudoviricetes sp.]
MSTIYFFYFTYCFLVGTMILFSKRRRYEKQ